MNSNNHHKYHAKTFFTTPNSNGYVRHGNNPHEICLTLKELEHVIRKDRQRMLKGRKGMHFAPSMTVYQGLGDNNVVGTYRLTDTDLAKLGTQEAA